MGYTCVVLQLVGRVSPNLRSRSLPLTQVKWHSVRHFGTRHPPIPPLPSWWHKILPPSAQNVGTNCTKIITNCTEIITKYTQFYHQVHKMLSPTAQKLSLNTHNFSTNCTKLFHKILIFCVKAEQIECLKS